MWQRIQTVWMVLASLALALFVHADIVEFYTEGGLGFAMDVWGLSPIGEGAGDALGTLPRHIPLGVVSWLSLLLTIVSIFLYRKRMLQMRLLNLSAILSFAILGIAGYYAWSYYKSPESFGLRLSDPEGLHWQLRFALCLPVVSLILQVMASLAVLKDETLIRMSNRLR